MSLLDNRLEAFLEISKVGTVFGAANALGLTQTAITQRIRSLERKLGVTLFTRSRKGMRLTHEGKVILQYCVGAHELEGAVFSRLSGGSKQGDIHITLAGPTSSMSRFVSGSIALMQNYSGLYFHFLIEDHSNLVDLIRTDRAQLAIVSPDQVPLEMDSKKISCDRFVLVCSSMWRGRKLEDILQNEKIIDFYESDRTTLDYLAKYQLEKKIGRPRLFVNGNSPLIEMFVAGAGFGTLTYEIAKTNVDSGKLILLNRGQAMDRSLALIWYPRPNMPEYFRSAIRTIK